MYQIWWWKYRQHIFLLTNAAYTHSHVSFTRPRTQFPNIFPQHRPIMLKWKRNIGAKMAVPIVESHLQQQKSKMHLKEKIFRAAKIPSYQKWYICITYRNFRLVYWLSSATLDPVGVKMGFPFSENEKRIKKGGLKGSNLNRFNAEEIENTDVNTFTHRHLRIYPSRQIQFY